MYLQSSLLQFVLYCISRFDPVRELVPIGTPVGTIFAAALNQTIFYSIVGGNELGTFCFTLQFTMYFVPNTP